MSRLPPEESCPEGVPLDPDDETGLRDKPNWNWLSPGWSLRYCPISEFVALGTPVCPKPATPDWGTALESEPLSLATRTEMRKGRAHRSAHAAPKWKSIALLDWFGYCHHVPFARWRAQFSVPNEPVTVLPLRVVETVLPPSGFVGGATKVVESAGLYLR